MIKIWRYWIVRPKALFLLSQFALLAAALGIAACSREPASASRSLFDSVGLVLLLLLPQACFYFNGLDTLIVPPDFRRFAAKALAALILALILTVPLFLIFPRLFPGYGGALLAVLASVLALFALRPLLYWLIKRRKFVEGLLILGTGDLARKVYKELAAGGAEPGTPAFLSAGAGQDRSDCPQPFEDSGETIEPGQLCEITCRDRISRIVVAESSPDGNEDLAVALLDCKLRGLQVEQAVESYERLNSKIWLEALRPEWLVYSDGFHPSRYYLPLKRCLDTICAALLLALAIVPMVFVAVLIKADSPGPVLFRQVRVGLHNERFVLYKFRTMQLDAERTTGPVWAAASDQRVTRIGKHLRKFRVDELPQLFNVLRGDMSLVGPRPERPHFVEILRKDIRYYGLRHCVKPGITGWAQVLYPYGASVQDAYEKLQYDLYYVKHMSIGFDLRILLGTFRVVLFGRGR